MLGRVGPNKSPRSVGREHRSRIGISVVRRYLGTCRTKLHPLSLSLSRRSDPLLLILLSVDRPRRTGFAVTSFFSALPTTFIVRQMRPISVPNKQQMSLFYTSADMKIVSGNYEVENYFSTIIAKLWPAFVLVSIAFASCARFAIIWSLLNRLITVFFFNSFKHIIPLFPNVSTFCLQYNEFFRSRLDCVHLIALCAQASTKRTDAIF